MTRTLGESSPLSDQIQQLIERLHREMRSAIGEGDSTRGVSKFRVVEWRDQLAALLAGSIPQETDVPEPIAGIWLRVLGHPKTDECKDMECVVCAMRDCPDHEPLHYHHDGCPCCTQRPTSTQSAASSVAPTATAGADARLHRAALALVEKLDAIIAHPSYKAVWTLALVHGHRYTGPNWEADRDELQAALAAAVLSVGPAQKEQEQKS